MIVRRAVPGDKIPVIRLLKDAHTAAGFSDGTNPLQYPFSAAYAERAFLSHTMTGDDAVCIVLEIDGRAQGVLMARAFDYELGPVRLADETVWWISPDARGMAAIDMLSAYEEWAGARGAVVAGMKALEAAPRAGVIYQRRCYQPIETHFVKSLSQTA